VNDENPSADRIPTPPFGVDPVAMLRDELAELRRDTDVAFADIRGERGDNGKLGALKARVDTLSARAWWVIATAIAGLGGAAAKLVIVSSTFASVQASAADSAERVRALEAEVSTLRSQLVRRVFRDLVPASPGKETP
jgi:hypothetical protein